MWGSMSFMRCTARSPLSEEVGPTDRADGFAALGADIAGRKEIVAASQAVALRVAPAPLPRPTQPRNRRQENWGPERNTHGWYPGAHCAISQLIVARRQVPSKAQCRLVPGRRKQGPEDFRTR